MTTHFDVPARPAARASALLSLTRGLAGLHALLGGAALVGAVLAFGDYRDAGPDETFAGLLVILGVGLVVVGAVLVVVGACAVLARRASATYALGLAAGLFLLATTGALQWWAVAWTAPAVAVAAVALALVACSSVGLASGAPDAPVRPGRP